MRVGTTLYKVVNQPCASGGYEKRRVIWNNSTLRQDYGKNYLATVPKYDGFCTVPDHLNYRKEIDGFLNLYEPIEHTPQIGDFPNIRSLVLHIFGEQYNLGLDYLQLLFLQPLQKLPILLLVSEERNTGKSTFLNFLKRIEEQTPHVRPVSFSFRRQSATEPSFQQLDIVQLSSPALLSYLQERGINTALAKRVKPSLCFD